jgi:hypothetical protein
MFCLVRFASSRTWAGVSLQRAPLLPWRPAPPAEAAGLIRLDASGPRFTHPLARLLAAADLALPTGQADWVRQLAGQLLTLTSPTSRSPTSLPPRRAPIGASKPGRCSSARWPA